MTKQWFHCEHGSVEYYPEDYQFLLDNLQRAIWRRDQDDAVGMLDEITPDCNMVNAALTRRVIREAIFA